MSDVTRIFSKIESGEPAAADQLLPLVYNELRKSATAGDVGTDCQFLSLNLHLAYKKDRS